MPAARSRLLAKLDAAITAAPNPIEARCLRAERAGLLARHGQLAAARVVIDDLNAQGAWQPNTALQAWLGLAEGLHAYYASLGPSAHAGIEQAYTLTQGVAALQRLHALAAAWLANLAFANDDLPRMGRLLREAFDVALPEHHGPRARAALVAAHAWHFAGEGARAQPWYDASRRHGVAEGDEAHLSALMHNQAWMRASQARMALFFDGGNASAAPAQAMSQALLAAESTGHYDAGIGTASLRSLVPMLRAQVLTAQGQWAQALALFESHFSAALADGLTRQAAGLLADRAWCEWHSGQPAKAQALAAAAEQALRAPCDIDDLAMATARLAQVCEALGDKAAAQSHRAAALRHHAAHREQQRRLAALLDAALAGIDPARI